MHPLNTDISVHKVQQEISCYQKNCIDSSVCYDINQLVTAAIDEEKMLEDAGLLSKNLSTYIAYKLNELIEAMPSLPRCLCHGDLSDNNIMQNKNKQMIVVDWEDAFIGIDGYDYLYWLTFFNNRKYYSDRNIFLNVKFDVNILSVIMIIKSALSYYSGHYKRNILSIQDRIIEIFKAAGE